MATISKTSTFEVPKFSQGFFLPFRSVGFCLPSLGHGASASRGKTPLHFAAAKGHVSVLQRLLEAKAAVDAKENNGGRGLGRGILGGKPS